MKYSKAQLNAISRSYAAKNRQQALTELSDMGIDYDRYCKVTGCHANPAQLVTWAKLRKAATLAKMEAYKKMANDSECYYTGGGIYIAQYSEPGYIWAIDSDMPKCLTKYRYALDETFMDENIVWSKEAGDLVGKDKQIYSLLHSMLIDEMKK